jgi:hypothetical protein
MCKSGGSLGRIVFPVDSHTAVLLCDVHVCFNCEGSNKARVAGLA